MGTLFGILGSRFFGLSWRGFDGGSVVRGGWRFDGDLCGEGGFFPLLFSREQFHVILQGAKMREILDN